MRAHAKNCMIRWSALISVCLLLVWAGPTIGQDLDSRPGNDVLTDLIPLPDGGYAVCGYTSSDVTDLAGFFARMDSSGDVLAAAVYDFEDWVQFTCITRLADGTLAMGGSCGDPRENDLDACLVLVNEQGTVLWQEVFGGNRNDEVSGIVPDGTGGCIMTGYTEDNSRFLNPFVARFDAQQILYFNEFGGDNNDFADTIVRRPDGNVIVAGSSSNFDDDSRDVYAFCATPEGSVLWETIFPLPLPQDAFGAVAHADGSVTVAGRTTVPDDNNPDNTDVLLLKFDSDGNYLWHRVYGHEGMDHAEGITLHPDGGYVVAGRLHRPLDAAADAWLLRADEAGDTLWTLAVGEDGYDQFNAISVRADTVYVAVGENDEGDGQKLDFYVLDQELGDNRLAETGPQPAAFHLRAYPNPFNPSLTAEVALQRPGRLSVDVVNILGQRVAVLLDEHRGVGVHRVQFTPTEQASGVYLLQARLDGSTLQQRKVVYLQ